MLRTILAAIADRIYDHAPCTAQGPDCVGTNPVAVNPRTGVPTCGPCAARARAHITAVGHLTLTA